MIILTVLYFITMLVAFLGNMFLIYIVWNKLEIRSLTSFMFVNMAVADLLVTLIVMPVSIAHLNTDGKWLIPGVFGEITCRTFPYFAYATLTASILCLTCMAIDRYYAIVHPLRRHLWFRKPKLVVPLIWIFSMASMSIALVTQTMDGETSICGLDFHILGDKDKALRGVFLYFLLLNYLLPLSVISVLYTITVRRLWSHNAPGIQNQKQQEITKKRVVRMLIIVATVFALCWLPGQVYQLIIVITSGNLDMSPTVMNLCYWFGHANSAINPWLYIGLSSNINSEFTRMMSGKRSQSSHCSKMKAPELFETQEKVVEEDSRV